MIESVNMSTTPIYIIKTITIKKKSFDTKYATK